jgi:hypothetical protein
MPYGWQGLTRFLVAKASHFYPLLTLFSPLEPLPDFTFHQWQVHFLAVVGKNI